MSNIADSVVSSVHSFKSDDDDGCGIVGRHPELISEAEVRIVCCGIVYVWCSNSFLNDTNKIGLKSSQHNFCNTNVVWKESSSVDIKIDSFIRSKCLIAVLKFIILNERFII